MPQSETPSPDRQQSEAKPRRTRIVSERQSKNGCFTCKDRRVKCDETFPKCLRCQRSKLECEGYRDSPPTSQTGPRTPTPPLALTCRSQTSLESHRLALLACTALQAGEATKPGPFGIVWSTTLPQLNLSTTTVATALSAFGAAIEVGDGDPRSNTPGSKEAAAAGHYDRAIRQLKLCIAELDGSIEPLLISCLILGCVELLRWRDWFALAHLRGAVELLQCRRSARPQRLLSSEARENTPPQPPNEPKVGESIFSMIDELDFAFTQLDIQATSFMGPSAPLLPPVDFSRFMQTKRTTSDAASLHVVELKVTQLLHNSYRLASRTSKYKYVSPELIPHSIAFEATHGIANLQQCIKNLGIVIADLNSASSPPSTGPSKTTFMILRVQCLSLLVFLSSTMSPFETSYDDLLPTFRQIVANVKALRQLVEPLTVHSPLGPSFSLGMGVMQPLLLTAFKCRDPSLRRQAIALLRTGGREGPFKGEILATVCERAMDIEENASSALDGVCVAADILEVSRLHGSGTDFESSTLDLVAGKVRGRQFEAVFSRCIDVWSMVDTGEHDSKGRFWETWSEMLTASLNT